MSGTDRSWPSQLQAQAGQGGDDPVGEGQLVGWSGSGLTPAVASAALAQPGLGERIADRVLS